VSVLLASVRNYIRSVCECACVKDILFYITNILLSGMRGYVLRYRLTNVTEDLLLPTSESLLYPEGSGGRFC
jgi:hypothetical protein